MADQSITYVAHLSFNIFLFKERRNKTILWFAGAAIVIQFLVFKYFYPFANFIHGDSFSYLNAAEKNLTINTYLIGYSKFLRLFSVFTKSDFFLTLFQYLAIQFSALFLLFTIFYFYSVTQITKWILLIFMVFNPLFLHLGNMVSSDGLFLALSLTWFTLLIWIVNKPSKAIVVSHAIVLFIAFTFRYNAMIYPVLSLIAFTLSKQPTWKKISGFSVSLLMCGWFVGMTMVQYKKLTGYWQYSPFSGWQLTNNAMYTYRYVNKSNRKEVPKRFQHLDRMIREYFDSTHNIYKHPQEALKASTIYMWEPKLTLYIYRNQLFKNDTSASELKKWASMGPLYKDYGLFIIKNYPWKFMKYFVWPNFQKYYAPPVEFLETYNTGFNFVTNETVNWFGYKSANVKTRMKDIHVWILDFYPILSGVINIVIFCCLVCYIILRGWLYDQAFARILVLGITVWVLNAAFTIFASSAALRFQSFPIIITFSFVTLLLNWMFKMMKLTSVDAVHSPKNNSDITVILSHTAMK